MDWLRALLPALMAAAVTMLLTPAVIRLAVRLRAVDLPGGRKKHDSPIPRLGGIAIAGGIFLSMGFSLMLLADDRPQRLTPGELLGFGGALLLIFALGLMDDIVGLRAMPKLLVQILAASIVVALGWEFVNLRLPGVGSTYVGAIAPLLSVLWIVGVTNAINFIDGLDGLAAGIVVIISTSLLVLAIPQHSAEAVIVTSCIAGACLGFLRHNRRPARIYMGDSGSLMLGFLLAAISLRSSVKASAAVAILVPILALGLPVLDSLLVIWYRFHRGPRRLNRVARVVTGDRKHLHHLLLETRAGRSRVVLTLYGLAVGFCLMALLVAASDNLWLGLGFLVVEFAAILLIRQAGLRAEARRQSQERRQRLQLDDPLPVGAESRDPQSRMDPAAARD